MSVSEIIKWYKIVALFTGMDWHQINVQRAISLCRECQHDDAIALCKILDSMENGTNIDSDVMIHFAEQEGHVATVIGIIHLHLRYQFSKSGTIECLRRFFNATKHVLASGMLSYFLKSGRQQKEYAMHASKGFGDAYGLTSLGMIALEKNQIEGAKACFLKAGVNFNHREAYRQLLLTFEKPDPLFFLYLEYAIKAECREELPTDSPEWICKCRFALKYGYQLVKFGDNAYVEPNVQNLNHLVWHYKQCKWRAKRAIRTWLMIARRLRFYKDMRIFISKLVFEDLSSFCNTCSSN